MATVVLSVVFYLNAPKAFPREDIGRIVANIIDALQDKRPGAGRLAVAHSGSEKRCRRIGGPAILSQRLITIMYRC